MKKNILTGLLFLAVMLFISISQASAFLLPDTGQFVLVDSGAEWRYSDDEQAGWTGTSFDDSQWSMGITPFNDHSISGWCGYSATGTNWPINTSLYLRKNMAVAQASDLTLKIAIDNDLILYFDGNEVAAITSDGCAYEWQYQYNIPAVTAGVHTISAKIIDRGDTSYFNLWASQGSVRLEISPNFHDFGDLTAGLCSSTPQQFTLSNTGGSDIMVSDISISDAANFSLLTSGGSNPCNANNPTITPGNSCTITVSFCPSTGGSFNANLEISSNDPDKKLIEIPIAGSGILQTKGKIAPGRLVIIDGIQILSILNPDYPDDYSHYLMNEIDGRWLKLIQQQIGIVAPFVWSRADRSEDAYISVLSGLLEKYSNENRETGGKLVVLAHSWGTVLAYVAISTNSNILVDKFISLGSPLNAQSADVRDIVSKDLAEWKIEQMSRPSNIVTWDNYWEQCDPISGYIDFLGKKHNFDFKTDYIDQETNGATCHSAYYEDFAVWQKILLDIILNQNIKR